MGSGTTAVACKELGRRFMGVEINKQYINIANKRLKAFKPIRKKDKEEKSQQPVSEQKELFII